MASMLAGCARLGQAAAGRVAEASAASSSVSARLIAHSRGVASLASSVSARPLGSSSVLCSSTGWSTDVQQRSALVMPPPGALRAIHTTAPVHSTMLVGGLSVAAAAVAASYAIRAYNAANPPEGGAEAGAKEAISGKAEAAGSSSGGGSGEGKAEAKPAASSHKGFGAEMLARRFYRGPFEDKMTKREASLILGVRESASPERIRDRHKKMLIQNHPDVGGSTYLAGKINEAKDMLLGRSR